MNQKPLVTDQRILTWLCILPAEENTSKWEKRAYIASVLALIVADLTVFTSSLTYTMKFMSIDLQKTMLGFYQAVAAIPMANAIIVAFLLRHKIPPVFDKLSEFYEKYKDEDSFCFMASANNKSEWLWKMYLKFFIRGFFVITAVSSIASVLICWLLNGHFDVTQVFHPLRFILPWDQSTLLGYIGDMIYSLLVMDAYLLYNGVVLLPFVSICLHHQAFYRMFCHSLRKLDHPDKNRNEKEFFCEIIDFHISIKRWFSETAEIYSPHLMVQLTCNVLILAVYIFQLDQQISKHFDINVFIFSLLGTIFALLNLFLCCFLGKQASESYKEMADSLYDSNWHELPLNLQKYFILMISNAQIPQSYHGYGLITLNLETFRALIRSVFAYFMMFRTLTAN